MRRSGRESTRSDFGQGQTIRYSFQFSVRILEDQDRLIVRIVNRKTDTPLRDSGIEDVQTEMGFSNVDRGYYQLTSGETGISTLVLVVR